MSYTRVGSVSLEIGGQEMASVEAFEGLLSGIQLIRRRVENPREFFNSLAGIVLNGIMDTLKTANQGGWASHSPKTTERRALKGTSAGAIFRSQPILNEHGDMVEAIQVLRIDERSMSIGVDDSHEAHKLALHEEGFTTSKGANVPSRPLLFFSSDMLYAMHVMATDYLDSLLEVDPHRARVRGGRLYQAFNQSYSNLWKESTGSNTSNYSGEVPF